MSASIAVMYEVYRSAGPIFANRSFELCTKNILLLKKYIYIHIYYNNILYQ